MIQSLADLQKLLFSLRCADPVKHLKEDVTNLFDSILSNDFSPKKAGDTVSHLSTITEELSRSDDFFTTSETSQTPLPISSKNSPAPGFHSTFTEPDNDLTPVAVPRIRGQNTRTAETQVAQVATATATGTAAP